MLNESPCMPKKVYVTEVFERSFCQPEGEAISLIYRLITEAKICNRLISSLVKFRKKFLTCPTNV